jgi:hypothetical protein
VRRVTLPSLFLKVQVLRHQRVLEADFWRFFVTPLICWSFVFSDAERSPAEHVVVTDMPSTPDRAAIPVEEVGLPDVRVALQLRNCPFGCRLARPHDRAPGAYACDAARSALPPRTAGRSASRSPLAATLQQHAQASISVAWLLPSQLQQLLAQIYVPVRSRLVHIARPIYLQQLAGLALAQAVLRLSERNLRP